MFVSCNNCYAWYLILMTFKMDFYQYNQIWALSFTIILNLRGQKLKSNLVQSFPRILRCWTVSGPHKQIREFACYSGHLLWIFAFSLSFPFLVPCHSVTFSSSSPQITVWRRLRLLVLWMHIRGKPDDQKDLFKRASTSSTNRDFIFSVSAFQFAISKLLYSSIFWLVLYFIWWSSSLIYVTNYFLCFFDYNFANKLKGSLEWSLDLSIDG